MNKTFYRLIFDRRRVLIPAFLGIITFSSVLYANTGAEENEIESMVELELKADPNASYNQRKTDWSKRFSLGIENFQPTNYLSPVDQSKYSELVGTNSLQMTELDLGFQFNTRVASFFIDTFYSIGSTSGVSNSVVTTIGLSKYGASFGVFLDSMFENPWVSPYVSCQAFVADWREVAPAMSVNTGGNIPMMFSYQFGFSTHLEKLDQESSRAAYAEYGLKNSFLDFYGVQVLKSANKGDPDFSTALNWGMNFRLEF